MTPRFFWHQTIGGPQGNCHEACLASLLDVPLDTVPRLYGLPLAHPQHEGLAWLTARGYKWVYAGLARTQPVPQRHAIDLTPLHATNPRLWDQHRWCVCYGPSAVPDGGRHAVLGALTTPGQGLLIWDPHPQREGLAAVDLVGWVIPIGDLPEAWRAYETVELYVQGDPRLDVTLPAP